MVWGTAALGHAPESLLIPQFGLLIHQTRGKDMEKGHTGIVYIEYRDTLALFDQAGPSDGIIRLGKATRMAFYLPNPVMQIATRHFSFYRPYVLALLDYGSGNIRSVEKALRKVDADVQRFSSADGLDTASGIVLPGVGAFDDCLNAIEHRHLTTAVKEWIRAGRPFLGICVGYQALFDQSEEFNSCAAGLGIYRGPVVRFQATATEPHLKIPQIGWNQVSISQPNCPLFAGIPDQSYFYFVHSFFPRPEDPSIVAGSTEYGVNFAAAIWRDNVWATQFHPEKSQAVGLQLLRNFVEYAEARR